ncbi:hypothetical protein VTI74DRAFT_1233 [Chaetomium olivicolor]
MGGFDTYCAICGCSLTGGVVGSTAPSALRRRRRIVARKREALERGDSEYGSDSESENDEDDQEKEEGEEEWFADQEDRSYDPELISEQGLEWLYESCCLGLNPEAQGDSKAFISGKSTSCENGCMEVEPGSDPNEPSQIGDTILYCFHAQDSGGIVVFPFHNCCLDILVQVLTGSKDLANVNKDVLYDAMSGLAERSGECLDLDYGSAEGRDQYWESVPGEEVSSLGWLSTLLLPKDLHDFDTAHSTV